MKERLTQAKVKAALRAVGITFRAMRDGSDEYRVNIANGTEATAYYTNDLEDALDTGREMALNEERAHAVRVQIENAFRVIADRNRGASI